MNPSFIKKIDYYVGIFICFFLTIFNKIFLLLKKRKIRSATSNDKILFIKFIEQGATVLAYDALVSAINKVGKENVYFIAFKSNTAILYLLNILPKENILVINDKDFFSFLKSIIYNLILIRKNKITVCIDMEFFSRASAIFSYLTGASIRVGLHRFNAEQPYRGDLMTHKIIHNSHLHISQYYIMLVDVAFEPSCTKYIPNNKIRVIDKKDIILPKYVPDKNSIELIYSKLKIKSGIENIEEKKIFLLNPNASDMLPIRKWDTNNFLELCKLILNHWNDALVVFTGAPSEKDAVEKLVSLFNSKQVISMAGETTFKELLDLYYVSHILITNDSGPGHFSTLTSTPTIVLFGPETPLLFGSLSPKVKIVYKNLACSPCVNVYNHRFSPCNNNLCMQYITVDEVFELCKQMAS